MTPPQRPRTESRVDVVLPVRLWGMESEWEPFTEKAEIVNVSLKGARLKGVRAQLRLGDVIALEHDGKKAAFQVVWVGKEGSAHAGEVGIFCLEPDKLVWGTIILTPEVTGVDTAKTETTAQQRPLKTGSPPAAQPRPGPGGDSIEFLETPALTEAHTRDRVAVRSPRPPHQGAPVLPAGKRISEESAGRLAAKGADVATKVLPVRRWINQRRTERVVIREPITVSGQTPQGKTFSEDTETLVVNSHGGLFLLRSPIEFGQDIRIRRKNSGQEVGCRIVYVGETKEQTKEVGVAFTSPATHFWGIAFPS
jgi:hypothetical protein